MADPKPISLTQVDEGDYDGARAPQRFVVVGDLPGGGALPATITAAELQAGTVTATRLVTPKLIHDEIARQIAAIPAP